MEITSVSVREVFYKKPRSKKRRIIKKWQKKYGYVLGQELITNDDFRTDNDWAVEKGKSYKIGIQ